MSKVHHEPESRVAREIGQVVKDGVADVGNYYQRVVLGVPMGLGQQTKMEQPENDGPSFGGRQHSTDFFPPRGIDGEILPPESSNVEAEPPPAGETFAGLSLVTIARGDSEPNLLPAPDRNGPDLDR